HTITLSMLVEVLEESHCHSVRVQAHGMKHPLQGEHSLQLDAPHPLDKTNLYDIGCTVEAKEIYTFKPKAGKTGMQVYEMFLPLGEGHGSIECIVQHKEQGLRVKIYPRYIHMIKAKGHQYSHMDPRTMGTAKTRLRAIEHFVSEMDEYHQLGGYRIEVSVRAATLSEVLSILEEKPLLMLDSWDEWLSVRCFTVGEVRGNVLRMLGHAWRQNILMGRDSKKMDELGKQVICDLGNAMGWSPGYRKPTLWSSKLAWWREGQFETGDHAWDPEVEDEEMKELKPRHERVAELGARNEMVAFFQSVRGGVPCCDCGAVNTYNLDGGKAQFRLACRVAKNSGVEHRKLSQEAALEYLSELCHANVI
ncbi:hypothetical protein FA10DRAFT_270260, partial [Acaromyces ingoldii]